MGGDEVEVQLCGNPEQLKRCSSAITFNHAFKAESKAREGINKKLPFHLTSKPENSLTQSDYFKEGFHRLIEDKSDQIRGR